MLLPPAVSPGQKLRQLIAKDIVVLPGVFNSISALAATLVGSKALYLSGAGVTNSLLGTPDIALITQTEMVTQASYVCQITPLPVIADADTGYGEAINVMRTVIEMEKAGLAGIHIEDQVSPKRCGHLDGKEVIPPNEMVQKVHVACESRKDPGFLIIARTDARAVEGVQSAIDRAKLYQDSGADVIFTEGLESQEEFEAFRKHLDVPLLANMTEFGKTPLLSVKQFKDLGYNLVIFPMTAFRVMLKAITNVYQEILLKGTQHDLLNQMTTRKELYELIEYDTYTELDQKWKNLLETSVKKDQ